MEVARLDRNGDGTIDSSAGDRVYLYFGMRRGGYHYYAVDVTTRTSPKLMWRIGRADSGIAVDSSKELPGVGQTWSSPTVARVNVDRSWGSNTDKMVLIFGGGYDTGQDSIGYSIDGVGNRIFMVDALTGDLIWYAGDDAGRAIASDTAPSKMTNAIPGEVRAVDLTGDGFADRMYAADLGGRVWRFDIKNGEPPASLVVGGVFASLGTGDLATTTGTAADEANRRFFYAPDVALMNSGGSSWINVAIGSGHREKPITDQTAINRFYSLRDYNVFTTVATNQYKTHLPVHRDGALPRDHHGHGRQQPGRRHGYHHADHPGGRRRLEDGPAGPRREGAGRVADVPEQDLHHDLLAAEARTQAGVLLGDGGIEPPVHRGCRYGQAGHQPRYVGWRRLDDRGPLHGTGPGQHRARGDLRLPDASAA